MAFAGLDVGTSGCKLITYDLDGNALSTSSAAYQELGDQGYREVDPLTVWDAVKKVLSDSFQKCPDKIEALAIASLGESIVCMDKKDVILGNSMVTGDKRGIDECKEIEASFSKEEVMCITGLPISEMYSLPKFIWMNKNTDTFQKAEKIFFYEDFVGYLLTGERKVSYSSASRSMAFEIEKKEWSNELLKLAGLSAEKFSTPVCSGTILGKILPKIADELGIDKDTVVVAGGHDQNCAAIGSGLTDGSLAEDGQGTCEVLLAMLPGVQRNDYMIANDLSCVPYVIEDTYLTLVEVTTCGILLNWGRDTLFADIKRDCKEKQIDFFAYLDSVVEEVPSEVILLPQFGSSGNPDINYDTRGVIWGLTIHTRAEEIYKAIREGIAYHIRMAYETLEVFNMNPSRLVVTGGGAKSSYNLQMRANVFNKEMAVLKNTEAGTAGCAIIAALALGKFKTYEEATKAMTQIERIYYPDPSKHELYEANYNKFKKLYNLMHDFH